MEVLKSKELRMTRIFSALVFLFLLVPTASTSPPADQLGVYVVMDIDGNPDTGQLVTHAQQVIAVGNGDKPTASIVIDDKKFTQEFDCNGFIATIDSVGNVQILTWDCDKHFWVKVEFNYWDVLVGAGMGHGSLSH